MNRLQWAAVRRLTGYPEAQETAQNHVLAKLSKAEQRLLGSPLYQEAVGVPRSPELLPSAEEMLQKAVSGTIDRVALVSGFLSLRSSTSTWGALRT